jgi:hypothetical protein
LLPLFRSPANECSPSDGQLESEPSGLSVLLLSPTIPLRRDTTNALVEPPNCVETWRQQMLWPGHMPVPSSTSAKAQRFMTPFALPAAVRRRSVWRAIVRTEGEGMRSAIEVIRRL